MKFSGVVFLSHSLGTGDLGSKSSASSLVLFRQIRRQYQLQAQEQEKEEEEEGEAPSGCKELHCPSLSLPPSLFLFGDEQDGKLVDFHPPPADDTTLSTVIVHARPTPTSSVPSQNRCSSLPPHGSKSISACMKH